jgi:hypothetical protein
MHPDQFGGGDFPIATISSLIKIVSGVLFVQGAQ